MKKLLSYLLLSFLCIAAFAQKEEIVFPKIHLLKMDSSSYLTNKDLKEGKNTVFINFSPTCEHCQRTIESILTNISKFKETQFVLTSFEPFSDMRKFYFDEMLSSFTNVFIGQEKYNELTSQLKYTSFPCLIIFDKDKNFMKKIDEETDAKALLKAMKIK